MTDPSPLAIGLGFLAFFVLVLAILVVSALVFRDRVADAPLMEPEPDYGGCSDTRPHVMLPTSYGWRCANDCGESWYVEESDELATADLALWELELDMGWAP